VRALSTLLLVLGCSPSSPADFVEAHGSFADGTPLDVHLVAQARLTTSVQPALGTVMALGAPATGPEDLRGFYLEWMPASVHENMPLLSSNSGPIIFYVEREVPDGGALDARFSVVAGGTIDFTMNRRLATGTLSNLVLSRMGQTILTVASGSFQATNP
jgi:hypothetical protein